VNSGALPDSSRRFPYGLTIAAALAVAACVGLGLWQVQRFHWKQGELAKIEALKRSPARPISLVLAEAGHGADADFTRVTADCAPAPPAPVVFSLSSRDGDYVWRAQSRCGLPATAADVTVDRGLFDSARGQTQTPAASLPAPAHVTGVLRKVGDRYVLVAEQESPAAPGVTPTPWQSQSPENLQYAGEYGPTWFGLAGVVAAFYAALLWRRYRPR